jgi:hypothetical protein
MPRLAVAGAPIVLLLVLLVVPGAGHLSAQSRSFFISVTDAAGAPVTDLTREEVIVESDGQRFETLDLERIDWPVRVTVFVDNGIGSRPALDHMREGLRLFLAALPPEVEVAIATIAGRPQIRARHTADREELMDAIGVIAPDDGAARFLDALYEEAERLHRDKEDRYFPVIVMVATNGPEGSSRVRDNQFREMMERLFADRATLHTRMFTNTPVSGVQQGGAQTRWAIDIGDATRGSYAGLSSPNGYRTLLPQLAEDIARKHRLVSTQYRLTYAVPARASGQSGVRILTSRAGIRMTATPDGNLP